MATAIAGSPMEHAVQSGSTGGRRASTQSRMQRAGIKTEQRREELPRAASYTYMPVLKDHHLSNTSVVDIKVVPVGNYAASQTDDTQDISPTDTSPPDSSGWNTPDGEGSAFTLPKARDITAHLTKTFSSGRRDKPGPSAQSSIESSTQAALATPTSAKRPSISRSLSRRFNRHSWVSSASSTPSRSPSPRKDELPKRANTTDEEIVQRGEGLADRRRQSLISRTLTARSIMRDKKNIENQQSEDYQGSDNSGTRRGSFLRRKSNSRVSLNISKDQPSSQSSAERNRSLPVVPALPKSFSTDRLPTSDAVSLIPDRAAPVPKLVSTEKINHSIPLSVTKKKDQLWGVFRTLDADYAKFSSKSTALKTNVVRNSLMPFLRTYAGHRSNKGLRLEDLDRRAHILNKWWTGLMELLHGRNNQSISGTDRPAILEGVLGIMERPEWRIYPSPFCSAEDRFKATLTNASPSENSFRSHSSDFLADSVHHNVRNIFIQNLSAQMAFVVEKMSLRNASASLVNFCGKACAYAFMFVPGMADVLVRLWDISTDTIRRVLSEHGIGRFDTIPDDAATLLLEFPPALQQLGFTTTLARYMRKLRTFPPLPPGTNHIEWWGHWTDRWSGRESDLFYIFTKQFHILMADFLPTTTTSIQRLAVPGLLLVHAQLLSNLDATIHRDVTPAPQDSASPGPSATFDELLGDPDIIASALPVPPINVTRLMAENRVVMLVRDFLSERTTDHPVGQDVFARSFNRILQAAARGTSLFDHSACYTLLDLLEEALVILVRYEHLQRHAAPLVDTEFWQSVCRRMMDSENTMTEIRLYTFLYTVWNYIVCDLGWKSSLCFDLLLEENVFESRFNHWCPMVRAYYMRLLCWRLARHDGNEAGDTLKIFQTIQERLLGIWSHYLYLCKEADARDALRPPTNPCQPAPGRRLLIIRTDNHLGEPSSLLTLEGLIRDSSSPMAKPSWKRTGSTSVLDGTTSRPESSSSNMDSETESPQKGITGLLKRMMGASTNKTKPQQPAKQPATRTPVDLTGGRAAAVAWAASDDGQVVKAPEKPPHQCLSFKFSLEPHTHHKQLPPLRLFPPRLPPPAQTYLQAKSGKSYSAESATVPVQPCGDSVLRSRYSGRALAEWTIVVGECHSFFERRKKEGAPSNKLVETPSLGVEVFKRPS